MSLITFVYRKSAEWLPLVLAKSWPSLSLAFLIIDSSVDLYVKEKCNKFLAVVILCRMPGNAVK